MQITTLGLDLAKNVFQVHGVDASGQLLFVPNALAASFTFEKPYCLSVLGIEELMGELKGGGARRAVKKTISPLGISIVVH